MDNRATNECQTSEHKIPLWRLSLLTASLGSIDLGYAVEGAYAVPLMRAAGVSLTFSTVLITLSPIVGLFFQAFLGSASDQCTCFWGRRRPFIVWLALTAVVGFGAAPYCFYFNEISSFKYSNLLVIGGIVMCVFLLDLGIGALQLPTRTYLLDVVPLSQSQTGNFISSISIGVNAALGYALGAIDWSSIIGRTATISHQVEIVFGIVAVLIFVSMLCTVFSVKERDPNFKQPKLQQLNIQEKEAGEDKPLLKVEIGKRPTCNICQCCTIFKESMFDIVKFIYYMSYNMWLLWLMVTLALAADFAFVYCFTTFVGIAVYNGDPSSPEDSYSYQQYAKGVRMGSLGLAISAVVCAIVSLGLDYITRWIRLKTVLMIILTLFLCSLCLLMYCRELYQVLILVSTYGPYLGVVITLPFALIPLYEEEGVLFRKKWHNQPASVEGKAVSVINTAVFAGQIIGSLIIGPVVDATQDVNYFMLIPCIFVTLAFLILLPVYSPVLKKQTE